MLKLGNGNLKALCFFSLLAINSCGKLNTARQEISHSQGNGTNPNAEDASQRDILSDFLNWTPVLNGDKTFESKGHGGILVRAYLNAIATDHAKTATVLFPMPVGSVLAKAVVPSDSIPSSEASRVYFMKKEAPGFDPEHGDWSYSLAKRKNGKLEFDPSIQPTEELCVSCHVKYKQFDNVETVVFFKNQMASAN